MPINPFLNCVAEQKDGSWRVGSDFWAVSMVNESSARRTAEIIRGAYEAGYRDKMDEIRAVLLGPDLTD